MLPVRAHGWYKHLLSTPTKSAITALKYKNKRITYGTKSQVRTDWAVLDMSVAADATTVHFSQMNYGALREWNKIKQIKRKPGAWPNIKNG